MNHRLWQTAVERAGRLAAPLAVDELPDADLLGRFTTAREEPAFAALVRRHGPPTHQSGENPGPMAGV